LKRSSFQLLIQPYHGRNYISAALGFAGKAKGCAIVEPGLLLIERLTGLITEIPESTAYQHFDRQPVEVIGIVKTGSTRAQGK
jgi:hypothetical protein